MTARPAQASRLVLGDTYGDQARLTAACIVTRAAPAIARAATSEIETECSA